MISGICVVCGKVDFVKNCKLCGNIICTSHFDSEKGICVECVRGK